MTRGAYYNEFDPKAAAWLRELIADGHIAAGDVDERSILDVTPDDLRGYTQCHWFAGIGGWSAALRLAGWPDDRPVWTGSCPCQPFSEAGGRAGLADERHLWPYWHHLIAQCRPRVVFGEQVEAAIRYGWLDLVRDDLEALDYAFGAAGLPAACVGAPHIRQRLWFVADTGRERGQPDGHDVGSAAGSSSRQAREQRVRADPGAIRVDGVGHPADASGQRFEQHAQCDGGPERPEQQAPRGPDVDGCSGLQLGVALGDAERTRLSRRLGLPGVPGWALGAGARQAAVGAGLHVGAIGRLDLAPGSRCEWRGDQPAHGEPLQTDPWASAIWIDCRDGKRRPVEPGIFPLASGVSGRVGLLRGSGNAIVPQVAAAFIEEYLATRSAI